MEIQGSGSQAEVKSTPKPSPPPKPAPPAPASRPAPKGPSEAEVHLSPAASAALEQEAPAKPSQPTATPSTVPINLGDAPVASGTAAETKETSGPPDLKTMTVDEQYDYLTQVVQSQTGDPDAWKTAKGEVNLVGIRSFQDGQPVEAQGDVYNDTIYAAWTDNEGQHHVQGFQASTDAGVVSNPEASGFGYSAGGKYKGLSHLADGFYGDSWVKGGVPGNDTGLRQSADVRINADTNNDGIIQANERLGSDANGDGLNDGLTESAGWGIQFHPGGSRDRQVDTWSAGCQVIVREEYQGFKDILSQATNKTYSYTLIDSSNLPPVGQGHAAANPPANQVAPPSNPAPPVTPPATPSATPPTAGTPSTPPAQPEANAAQESQAAPQARASREAAPSQRPAAQQGVPQDLKQALQAMAPGMEIPDTFEQLIAQLLNALLAATTPARGSWSMARNFMQRDVQLAMLQLVVTRAQTMGVALSGDTSARLSQLKTLR